MIGRGTRILVNTLSILAIVWIGTVVYQSFVHTGLWRVVDAALATEFSRASPAAVFAICALVGIVPLGLLGWPIWYVCLRGRPGDDFPRAKLARR